MLQTITFAPGKNAFCSSDKLFGAGDERVEKRSNSSLTHDTFSYQRLSSRTSLEIATHRYAPSKTGGSHALVLTCEYATPTSYISNRILCWTKRPSTDAFKLTKLIEKTINELLLTFLARNTLIMKKFLPIIIFLNSHNFTLLFFYFAPLFFQLFYPKTKIHALAYKKLNES